MKILIAGYGKMGHMVEEMARQKGWRFWPALSSSDAGELQTLEKADVAVDFSHPATPEPLAAYIRRTGTPLVSGTTGYSEEQMDFPAAAGRISSDFVFRQLQPGRCSLSADLGKIRPGIAGKFRCRACGKTPQSENGCPQRHRQDAGQRTGPRTAAAPDQWQGRPLAGPEAAMRWACLPCGAVQ